MRGFVFLLVPLQALATFAVTSAEPAPIEPAAYTIDGLPPGAPGTSAELAPVEPARKISKERAERVITQGRQGRDVNIKAMEKSIKESQDKIAQAARAGKKGHGIFGEPSSDNLEQVLRVQTQRLSEMKRNYRISFPDIALRECRVGDAGVAADRKLKIISIVDGANAIAEYDDALFSPTSYTYSHHYIYFWLKGFQTKGLTDDVEVEVRCPIEATGTTAYTTAGQSKRTILVLEPFVIDKQELQKVEAENKAAVEKAEADRMAETAAEEKAEADKRAAAEKAEAGRKAAEEEAKWHTWTDSTGKYKTKAMFGGMAGGKVKLIKKDGSTVRLPLNTLSQEDQDWLNKKFHRKAVPAAATEKSDAEESHVVTEKSDSDESHVVPEKPDAEIVVPEK